MRNDFDPIQAGWLSSTLSSDRREVPLSVACTATKKIHHGGTENTEKKNMRNRFFSCKHIGIQLLQFSSSSPCLRG
jgi:hypothetical protein